MRSRRAVAARDQDASQFAVVLMRLCDSVGAVAAALVDGEGETVDYAGSLDPFDVKIVAAECSIILDLLRRSPVPTWSETEVMIIRGSQKTFYSHALDERYAIVLQLPTHAFSVSRRALAEAIREICREAGFEVPASIEREAEQWVRVEVQCEAGRRPSAVWVDGSWSPIDVIGLYDGLAKREEGYRARLATGAEITLIREPLGHWYADVRIGR